MPGRENRTVAGRGASAKEEFGIQLLKSGMRSCDVARHARIAVDPSTVSRWAKKHGFSLPRYNRHKDRVDLLDHKEVIRLRKQKVGKRDRRRPAFTLQEIADLCGCSLSYVKKIVSKAKKSGKL